MDDGCQSGDWSVADGSVGPRRSPETVTVVSDHLLVDTWVSCRHPS